MAAKGNGEHPWVQPIVVLKTGSHEDTVRLGALASLAISHDRLSESEQAAVDDWLSGPFTKTVRRASEKEITKLKEWCEENSVSYTVMRENNSVAMALVPMRYDEFPKELSRLQVNGTDFSRNEQVMAPAEVSLHVLSSLTTGKATAQAAHALWLWALDSPLEWGSWSNECALSVLFSEFTENDVPAEGYAIHDNGLTEIEAGTLTAYALYDSL